MQCFLQDYGLKPRMSHHIIYTLTLGFIACDEKSMNKILTIVIGLLFCGTVSAQQIIEWRDLDTSTDRLSACRLLQTR